MNEINPSARMQVRGVGELMHPGACAVCGNGTCEDGYVDPGVYYDYEGQVYFCMRCVEELIATVGGATGAELLVTADLTTRSMEENERLKRENEALNAELEQYRSLMRVANQSSPSDTDSVSVLVGESIGLSEINNDQVGESTTLITVGPDESEPVATKPSKSDGPPKSNGTKRGNGSKSTRNARVAIDL